MEREQQPTFRRFESPITPGLNTGKLVFKGLPVATLVAYLEQIRAEMPETRLKDVNMEEQLLLQYKVTLELQEEVMSDEETPANQKAQVANSVASILQKLLDMQVEVYSSERFKEIELLLVRFLNHLPEEIAAEFLNQYEKLLQEV